MNFKKMLPLLFILVISSCGKKNEDNKKSNNKELSTNTLDKTKEYDFSMAIKRKVELNSDESNYLEYKENINNYQVEFESLSGQIAGAEVICGKGSIKNSQKTFRSSFDIHGEKAIVDLKLEASDKNTTEFKCEILDYDEVVYSTIISLKKSFVISKTENPESLGISNSSIGTLILEKGGEIATYGATTSIEIDELISYGGNFSTFPKVNPPATPNDTHGLNGGIMIIKTKTSRGSIIFNLIGLNGGAQTKVPDQIQKTPKFTSDLNGKCKGKRHIDSNYKKDSKCFGKKGHKGFKGQQGFPGYNGGNSGSVHFIQEEASETKIQILYSPGKGASGGVGGKGGNGSKGGTGSVIELFENREPAGCPMCPMLSQKSNIILGKFKYPDGAFGDEGDKGDIGKVGFSGKNDESFLDFADGTHLKINDDFTL